LGVRPLGFSGLMYLQCPGCGHVAKIIIVEIIREELELWTLIQQVHFFHVVSELYCVTNFYLRIDQMIAIN
jgi:hypothetical protein